MRKIHQISHQEKMEIYNKYRSDKYYVKEICEQHHMSYTLFKKIIEEIEELIKVELYGTK